MKKDIHPKYDKCSVKCVCGNAFETRSVISEINVEVCGACHPIYTGKKKIVDSTGRVDRFKKMIGQKKKSVISKKDKRTLRSKKKAEEKSKVKNIKKESVK
jgi:large subunit ribosomal protein L31